LPKNYPKELKTLGDHLRKKRLDLKLEQKELGKILGVSKATILNWERNRTSPRLDLLPRIVKFLGYIPFESKGASLGEKIVNFRKLQGMTQEEMAKILGVDPSTLARWEKNKRRPLPKYLVKLKEFMDGFNHIADIG
jgi:transcriptional regulator with XRE-family HTH domain